MTANACPGCNRPGRACWVMPCLDLEVALASGRAAVATWATAVGATLTPKGAA